MILTNNHLSELLTQEINRTRGLISTLSCTLLSLFEQRTHFYLLINNIKIVFEGANYNKVFFYNSYMAYSLSWPREVILVSTHEFWEFVVTWCFSFYFRDILIEVGIFKYFDLCLHIFSFLILFIDLALNQLGLIIKHSHSGNYFWILYDNFRVGIYSLLYLS